MLQTLSALWGLRMTNKITLPALPEPAGIIVVGTQALRAFTADQLCARDLEVARVVLEAAAQEAERNGEYLTEQVAEVLYATAINIRTLEVGHD